MENDTKVVNIPVNIPDIPKMIRGSIEAALSQDKIQAVIDKCCTDVVNTAITEQFRWNGKIKNTLEKHITDTIGIDPQKLPVPEYTHLIAEGFSQALEGMEDEKIRQEAKNIMANMLSTAPKEIKLSELAELYIEAIKSDFNLEDNKEVDIDYEDDGKMIKTFQLQFTDEPRWPDSGCLKDCRILQFKCPELESDKHILFLDVTYIDDKDDKATFSDANYATRYGENISKMDLKNWTTSTSLHQLLYKMSHAKTVIVMDVNKVTEDFEVEIECRCG